MTDLLAISSGDWFAAAVVVVLGILLTLWLWGDLKK